MTPASAINRPATQRIVLSARCADFDPDCGKLSRHLHSKLRKLDTQGDARTDWRRFPERPPSVLTHLVEGCIQLDETFVAQRFPQLERSRECKHRRLPLPCAHVRCLTLRRRCHRLQASVKLKLWDYSFSRRLPFSQTIFLNTSGGASFFSIVSVARAMHRPADAPRPDVPRPSTQEQSLPNISLF